MKKLAPLLILALCLIQCSKPAPVSRPPTLVNTTKVIRGDVPLYHDYIGHGSAWSAVDIYSQAAGKIMTQEYDAGILVKAGDLLFTIDDRQYISDLKKAEAELEANLANLALAKEKTERYTILIKDEIISQFDYDQALTEVVSTEALVESNRADIQKAKINLQYTKIRAPVTSIPGISGLNVGTYVPVGGSTPLVTLQQIDPMSVNFYVPEQHFLLYKNLQNKQPLRVQAFSIEDTPAVYEGFIDAIDNMMDKKTGTIRMQGVFKNPHGSMWPKQFFRTRLHYGLEKNALIIPEEAIVITQEGNIVYVVKDDMTVEARPVTIGTSYESFVVVKKGISEGEQVVLEGQINLAQGTKVAIHKEEITKLPTRKSEDKE